MHDSQTTTGITLLSWPQLIGLVVLFLVAVPALAAPPTVFTVGGATGCNYYSTRDALAVAATHVGGPVEIRISWSADHSLGYSWPATDSEVVLTNPLSDITLVGGYASCSASSPTAGARTQLVYANPTNDAPHTMLRIVNNTANPRRYLDLVNIDMKGASDSALGGPNFGGGLYVRDRVEVTLLNSSVSGFYASSTGGGVLLQGSSGDPGLYPRLHLRNDSVVSYNKATFGGGIYSSYARVIMSGAQVEHNSASDSGGGLYIADLDQTGDDSNDSNFALVLDNDGDPNYISNNDAGMTAPFSTSGSGGGVYSYYGQIRFKPHLGGPAFQSHVIGNRANRGGGIYAKGRSEGAGGRYTPIRMADTYFALNSSRAHGGALYSSNAVDWQIYAAGGECTALLILVPHPSPCSLMLLNKAGVLGGDGAGSIARGGAIYLTNTRTDGYSRGIVRFSGTWFTSNSDAQGLAAVAAVDGASEFVFNRNIFTDNSAGTGASALIYSHTGKDVDFRYNTVLDSNTSTRMFNIDGGTLNVTGSILWGTVDRTHPFHFVWFSSGGANMIHAGCLLVRASDDGTADIPLSPSIWSGYEPQLDARFAPRGSSPAIDHCDSYGYSPGSPPKDAYWNAVYDVPGVAARWTLSPPYNFDLGAVEQNDIIFANGLGNRPDN